jgi:biotin carboxyl carrier protein
MKTQKNKSTLWVQYNGRIYGLSLKQNSRSGASADEAKELVAPFSCKILKVHAKAGQKLNQGDPVLVVEAMKMEYSYASPREGIAEEILVKEGQTVSAGQQFVRWKERT